MFFINLFPSQLLLVSFSLSRRDGLIYTEKKSVKDVTPQKKNKKKKQSANLPSSAPTLMVHIHLRENVSMFEFSNV